MCQYNTENKNWNPKEKTKKIANKKKNPKKNKK